MMTKYQIQGNQMNAHKEKILLLLKYEQVWETQYVEALSHEFEVEIIYADELLRLYGSRYLISSINKKLSDDSINIIFIEVDFYPAIDAWFIKSIIDVKKIMFSFDDLMFHERNAITAAGGMCDLVLTADPVSVLKYEEKLINAHLIFNDSTLPDYSVKDINQKYNDVLFFGLTSKGDRSIFIDYLKNNGINVKVVGDKERISQENLLKEIRSSKIILNLSKSSDTITNLMYGYVKYDVFPFLLQFKLRIIEAGLNGSACVSEYTPALRLMFSEQELPTYKTKEECLDIIRELLNNEELLDSFEKNLCKAVIEKYESKPLMNAVAKKIENAFHSEINLNMPRWYYLETLKARIKITHYKNPIIGPFKELCSFHYPSKHWYSWQNLYLFKNSLFEIIRQCLVFYFKSILNSIHKGIGAFKLVSIRIIKKGFRILKGKRTL